MDTRLATSEFLKFCRADRHLAQYTIDAYTSDLNDFVESLFTSSLIDISATVLASYLQDMVSQRKLACATVRRRFACLRSFFRWFAAMGYGANVFDTWRPKLPRQKSLPRAISRQEASCLVKSLHNGARDAADRGFEIAVQVMISTGIRVGELCRIGIEDVSMDGSSLRIHGKGSRERMVYVTDAKLRRGLSQLVQSRRKNADSTTLFVNRYNLPVRPQSIRSKLRSKAARAGLSRRVTPHMLRHTAATLLVETGVDIRFVQRLLGHSSIATTEIYTHVCDEVLRAKLEGADVLRSLSV